MYSRILVATDGSNLSEKAVNSAIAMAALCKAELVVLKVVENYPQSYFEGGISMQPDEIKRIEQQWMDEGQSVVDGVKKDATAKGVSTTAMIVRSDVVSDAILNAASTLRCDLIVMASHGRRGIKRLLLGSETQHVLTHASIPVLVLK
jgi:nucleotide-binding universal stress UspA family protein